MSEEKTLIEKEVDIDKNGVPDVGVAVTSNGKTIKVKAYIKVRDIIAFLIGIAAGYGILQAGIL